MHTGGPRVNRERQRKIKPIHGWIERDRKKIKPIRTYSGNISAFHVFLTPPPPPADLLTPQIDSAAGTCAHASGERRSRGARRQPLLPLPSACICSSPPPSIHLRDRRDASTSLELRALLTPRRPATSACAAPLSYLLCKPPQRRSHVASGTSSFHLRREEEEEERYSTSIGASQWKRCAHLIGIWFYPFSRADSKEVSGKQSQWRRFKAARWTCSVLCFELSISEADTLICLMLLMLWIDSGAIFLDESITIRLFNNMN
jgi:hypothetical protein